MARYRKPFPRFGKKTGTPMKGPAPSPEEAPPEETAEGQGEAAPPESGSPELEDENPSAEAETAPAEAETAPPEEGPEAPEGEAAVESPAETESPSGDDDLEAVMREITGGEGAARAGAEGEGEAPAEGGSAAPGAEGEEAAVAAEGEGEAPSDLEGAATLAEEAGGQAAASPAAAPKKRFGLFGRKGAPAGAGAPAKGLDARPRPSAAAALAARPRRSNWKWIVGGFLVLAIAGGTWYQLKKMREENRMHLAAADEHHKKKRWTDCLKELKLVERYGIDVAEPKRFYKGAHLELALIEAAKPFDAKAWASAHEAYLGVLREWDAQNKIAKGRIDDIRKAMLALAEDLRGQKKYEASDAAARELMGRFQDSAEAARCEAILFENAVDRGRARQEAMAWDEAIKFYEDGRRVAEVSKEAALVRKFLKEMEWGYRHCEVEEENFQREKERARRFIRNGGKTIGYAASEMAAIIKPGNSEGEDLKKYARTFRGMEFVPPGPFIIGSEEPGAFPNEGPRHPGFEPGYYVDRLEVTNQQYRHFLREAGSHKSCHEEEKKAAKSKDHTPAGWDQVDWAKEYDHAVGGLDFFDAWSYAKWAGKKVPTEFQWEKAARGLTPRRFPWGNEELLGGVTALSADSGPAGSRYNGRSPFFLFDMAGNVAEWTQSPYEPYPANVTQDRSYGKGFYVIRGGSFMATKTTYSTSYRIYAKPLDRVEKNGMRAVRSPE